jgi:hypothetical protein
MGKGRTKGFYPALKNGLQAGSLGAKCMGTLVHKALKIAALHHSQQAFWKNVICAGKQLFFYKAC